MIALIFGLCALLLLAGKAWYAHDGRKAMERGNPVRDLRDAEAWATQLDRDLMDHWETPARVARAVRAGFDLVAQLAIPEVKPRVMVRRLTRRTMGCFSAASYASLYG